MLRRLFIASALSLAAIAAHAQAVELSGAKFEPTVQVANTRLALNGAGIRYKIVIKVYAAGLYLGTKASTTEAVLAAPGPKRMHLVMLREIDSNEFGKLFTRGMQDNAGREEFAKSIPGTIRMGEMFAARRKLLAGDSVTVDYTPGIGTSVLINGKPEGGAPIKEPEFFNALLKIWLGEKPADHLLKDALLGHSRA
jgi:hypothetical protein